VAGRAGAARHGVDRAQEKGGARAACKAFAATSFNVPCAAVLAGHTRVSLGKIGTARLAAGVALCLIILFAHEYVIGVPPLAP